jgi:hypothetical protein
MTERAGAGRARGGGVGWFVFMVTLDLPEAGRNVEGWFGGGFGLEFSVAGERIVVW